MEVQEEAPDRFLMVLKLRAASVAVGRVALRTMVAEAEEAEAGVVVVADRVTG